MIHEVIKKVLRKMVPEASEASVLHQMDYLDVKWTKEKFTLTGAYGQGEPTFLNDFYGKDRELIPVIQDALYSYYRKSIAGLHSRVSAATRELAFMKIPASSLWLNENKGYLVNSPFLGLEVKYHKHEEEFVAALQYGRAHPLPYSDPVDITIGPIDMIAPN